MSLGAVHWPSVAFTAGLATIQCGAVIAAVEFVINDELQRKVGECRKK